MFTFWRLAIWILTNCSWRTLRSLAIWRSSDSSYYKNYFKIISKIINKISDESTYLSFMMYVYQCASSECEAKLSLTWRTNKRLWRSWGNWWPTIWISSYSSRWTIWHLAVWWNTLCTYYKYE